MPRLPTVQVNMLSSLGLLPDSLPVSLKENKYFLIGAGGSFKTFEANNFPP